MAPADQVPVGEIDRPSLKPSTDLTENRVRTIANEQIMKAIGYIVAAFAVGWLVGQFI